jgi:nucleotide sugar dehydrogenase
VDEASLAAVESFYGSLVERTVPVGSTQVAELTKLLENTFRHVNIALVNELAMFAHDLGIDIWEGIDAASTKPYGYMRFTPGPGVVGHCLPIDPSYLSWRVKRTLGHSFRFVDWPTTSTTTCPITTCVGPARP